MKLSKLVAALAVSSAALLSTSANALIVQDGWAITTNFGTTSNIGHLGLNSGLATVNQQIGPGGTPFVGAQFSEFGQIFSVNYTKENCAGFCDSGLPVSFGALNSLSFNFSGLAGVVTAYNAITGKVNYSFTPGVGTVTLTGSSDGGATNVTLATLKMAGPSGGDLSDFNGQAQTSGQSTILANFTSFLGPFSVDLAGPGLGYVLPSDLYLQIQTTNKISTPFVGPVACSFDPTKVCATAQITSDGSADMLKIPEPSSIALFGLGLLALGAYARRRQG